MDEEAAVALGQARDGELGGWGVDVGGKWQPEPTQGYLCGRNPAPLLLNPPVNTPTPCQR